jgi:hypothetical protein
VLGGRIARGEDGAVEGGDTAGVLGKEIGLLVSFRRHLVSVSTYSSLKDSSQKLTPDCSRACYCWDA